MLHWFPRIATRLDLHECLTDSIEPFNILLFLYKLTGDINHIYFTCIYITALVGSIYLALLLNWFNMSSNFLVALVWTFFTLVILGKAHDEAAITSADSWKQLYEELKIKHDQLQQKYEDKIIGEYDQKTSHGKFEQASLSLRESLTKCEESLKTIEDKRSNQYCFQDDQLKQLTLILFGLAIAVLVSGVIKHFMDMHKEKGKKEVEKTRQDAETERLKTLVRNLRPTRTDNMITDKESDSKPSHKKQSSDQERNGEKLSENVTENE